MIRASVTAIAALAALLATPASAQPIFADGFELGVPPPATAWHQHAADAQRRSYVANPVPTPWRWKWAWNGPTATGAIVPGKSSLPRNVQPV
ncbi:MAG: pyrrolo-quinoline quinone, partial [Oscillochloridaceae bacterium]|nr:pyrrolo-quinoline quinone [Oscillochloridaceae bacterium]